MISKIRHQTCEISDFHTECYMHEGSDLQYGLINDKQSIYIMQLKIGRN